MKRFGKLRTDKCPFGNLPEARSGRWGAGLTAAKMKDCQWLKPELVGQFEFLEWTPENHLRHTRFIELHEDKSCPLKGSSRRSPGHQPQSQHCRCRAMVPRLPNGFPEWWPQRGLVPRWIRRRS